MLGVVVDSRVSTAHRMRAFLLAGATRAFCHPIRSRSCSNHCEMQSITTFGRGQQCGLRALDQQGAQAVIAALGDALATAWRRVG